jgi:4-hydroxy-3-polyprenylbenzoate decarboxylase
MYPGHSTHVATAVAGCTSGHYRLKGIIVVDDDIPADDPSKIIWALSVRFDPERGTQVLRRTRGGPLDPAVPIEGRDMGSKIILDACIPFEWKRKPTKIELDKEIVEVVEKRWKEYGL